MSNLISIDPQTLRALTEHPETDDLMCELSPDELSKATIDTRHFAEAGTHTVYVGGEPFFSFELWLGRIQNVKRLREKKPDPEPERTKWEYFIKVGPDDDTMKMVGNDGWELVAAVQGADDVYPTLYFKRPKV